MPMRPTASLLRSGTPDDLPGIARLEQLVRRQCLPYLPELHTEAETLAFFRDVVFQRCTLWVAETDGVLQGFCAARDGWVDHLYVYPTLHNHGLGTALLGQAMAAWPRLALFVFQRNVNAIRFYRARGFQTVETTDGSRNEEREPDARMVWSRTG